MMNEGVKHFSLAGLKAVFIFISEWVGSWGGMA